MLNICILFFILEDSSDSGKDSRTLKPFARISMSEMDGELNPVFEKAMPGHSDNAGKNCPSICDLLLYLVVLLLNKFTYIHNTFIHMGL